MRAAVAGCWPPLAMVFLLLPLAPLLATLLALHPAPHPAPYAAA